MNHKRIERLMRTARLRGVSRRRGFVVTTQRDRLAKAAPDLVRRQFKACGINQLWVAHMTYVPTWAGFLYLAVVVDVYSRKVVGWAFGERMTSDLVIASLVGQFALAPTPFIFPYNTSFVEMLRQAIEFTLRTPVRMHY